MIHFFLHYLSSGRILKVKNKGKFQTFSFKSGHSCLGGRGPLKEVPKLMELGNFWYLENWSLCPTGVLTVHTKLFEYYYFVHIICIECYVLKTYSNDQGTCNLHISAGWSSQMIEISHSGMYHMHSGTSYVHLLVDICIFPCHEALKALTSSFYPLWFAARTMTMTHDCCLTAHLSYQLCSVELPKQRNLLQSS